jgi:hypothetical protein
MTRSLRRSNSDAVGRPARFKGFRLAFAVARGADPLLSNMRLPFIDVANFPTFEFECEPPFSDEMSFMLYRTARNDRPMITQVIAIAGSGKQGAHARVPCTDIFVSRICGQQKIFLDDRYAIGVFPYALTALEMIDVTPHRKQVRRFNIIADEGVIGFAMGVVAVDLTQMVGQAMMLGDARRTGTFERNVDEKVR